MKTLTISAKMSGTGSIHNIADVHDRDIRFPKGTEYAVVVASYYGGKGYTTHKTADAAINKSKELSDTSHEIIDADGNEYDIMWAGHESLLIRK